MGGRAYASTDSREGFAPVQLPASSAVEAIAANDWQSFFLLRNGSVFATGKNKYGELGVGGWEDCSAPSRVLIDNLVHKVFLHWSGRSFFLLRSGDLYASGRNYKGQLGIGDYEHRCIPVRVLTNGTARPLVPPLCPPLNASQQKRLREAWPLGEAAFQIFTCPFTGGVMTDPVVAGDGCTYERDAIARWLSPLDLPNRRMVPNHVVRILLRILIERAFGPAC